MNREKDYAYVLRRTNYGETDRIVTLLCSEYGKKAMYARGVRGQKSRLAAGVELLTRSQVGFVRSAKGSLDSLISARPEIYFSEIVKDMERMNKAFDALKLLDKVVDDGTGQEYFVTLDRYFTALNNDGFDDTVCHVWFQLHVMQQAGLLGEINADLKQSDSNDPRFNYNFDEQLFEYYPGGAFGVSHVKLLRVLSGSDKPIRLKTLPDGLSELGGLVSGMVTMYFEL